MRPGQRPPSVFDMATTPRVQSPKQRKNGSRTSVQPAPRERSRLSSTKALIAGTVLAVVVAGILIGVSVVGSNSSSSTPSSLAGVQAAQTMLKGIPQHGTVLGRSTAPVRLVEYRDLQFPIC